MSKFLITSEFVKNRLGNYQLHLVVLSMQLIFGITLTIYTTCKVRFTAPSPNLGNLKDTIELIINLALIIFFTCVIAIHAVSIINAKKPLKNTLDNKAKALIHKNCQDDIVNASGWKLTVLLLGAFIIFQLILIANNFKDLSTRSNSPHIIQSSIFAISCFVFLGITVISKIITIRSSHLKYNNRTSSTNTKTKLFLAACIVLTSLSPLIVKVIEAPNILEVAIPENGLYACTLIIALVMFLVIIATVTRHLFQQKSSTVNIENTNHIKELQPLLDITKNFLNKIYTTKTEDIKLSTKHLKELLFTTASKLKKLRSEIFELKEDTTDRWVLLRKIDEALYTIKVYTLPILYELLDSTVEYAINDRKLLLDCKDETIPNVQRDPFYENLVSYTFSSLAHRNKEIINQINEELYLKFNLCMQMASNKSYTNLNTEISFMINSDSRSDLSKEAHPLHCLSKAECIYWQNQYLRLAQKIADKVGIKAKLEINGEENKQIAATALPGTAIVVSLITVISYVILYTALIIGASKTAEFSLKAFGSPQKILQFGIFIASCAIILIFIFLACGLIIKKPQTHEQFPPTEKKFTLFLTKNLETNIEELEKILTKIDVIESALNKNPNAKGLRFTFEEFGEKTELKRDESISFLLKTLFHALRQMEISWSDFNILVKNKLVTLSPETQQKINILEAKAPISMHNLLKRMKGFNESRLIQLKHALDEQSEQIDTLLLKSKVVRLARNRKQYEHFGFGQKRAYFGLKKLSKDLKQKYLTLTKTTDSFNKIEDEIIKLPLNGIQSNEALNNYLAKYTPVINAVVQDVSQCEQNILTLLDSYLLTEFPELLELQRKSESFCKRLTRRLGELKGRISTKKIQAPKNKVIDFNEKISHRILGKLNQIADLPLILPHSISEACQKSAAVSCKKMLTDLNLEMEKYREALIKAVSTLPSEEEQRSNSKLLKQETKIYKKYIERLQELLMLCHSLKSDKFQQVQEESLQIMTSCIKEQHKNEELEKNTSALVEKRHDIVSRTDLIKGKIEQLLATIEAKFDTKSLEQDSKIPSTSFSQITNISTAPVACKIATTNP